MFFMSRLAVARFDWRPFLVNLVARIRFTGHGLKCETGRSLDRVHVFAICVKTRQDEKHVIISCMGTKHLPVQPFIW
jgi:hypothetical protein